MQQQLHACEPGATIELRPYLTRLCETLALSMIGNRRPISLKVHIEGGTASSSQAVSIGLIVTELVINALKHAFPDNRPNGTVVVAYELAEPNWRLTVSDNGIGRPDKLVPGLGTTIVEALAKQLDAHVDALMTPLGTTVSVIKATFVPRPAAST
jgi:two-component sensor histidine kinase